jgi:long-chain acyl-CoA synthetase
MTFLTEISGPPVTGVLAPMWMFEQIESWAKREPGRFAFVLDHQDRVEQYRYREVLEHAGAIAACMLERGIQPGDRIGILMENTPQWVFVLLGSMQIGVVTVPLATTLPEDAIERIAHHAGCKLIFADETNWGKAGEVGKRLHCEIVGAVGEAQARQGAASEDDRPRSPDILGGHRPPLQDGTSTAILIYTSGTTGNPKGVELTFDNLNHEIHGAIEALQLSADHRILSVLPFSHVLPLIANGLGPLCIGATVVFLSSISPQRIVDAFRRHRITFFVCVPQFFYILHRRIFSQVESQSMLKRQAFQFLRTVARRTKSLRVRRKLFSQVHSAIGPDLQLLASGGSRFDPQVAKDLSELGYSVAQAYGLTETSAAATATPPDLDSIGTVGTPLRGVTVQIDSPNDQGIGEVWIRGPILMKGYYQSPQQTAEAIKDGWFRTGDLGFINPKGYVSITGRSKDVIVLANGENVYPEELETHYSRSPFIRDICIMGISQNGSGPGKEVLHAIVVPDMDEFRKCGQTAIMEMIRFEIENLSKQVPSYYRIHSLAVRNDPLPRTVTRKLKRFEIQREESDRIKNQDRREPAAGAAVEDHPRLRQGVGLVLAALVREAKPETGALNPSMNMELDLGFDSLARVELLGLAETRLGVHIDEQEATRIFTLGELVDAFEKVTGSEATARTGGATRSWKDILSAESENTTEAHYIFKPRRLFNPVALIVMRVVWLLSRLLFRLRCHGLEKLPRSTPFMLCPNHESFLDGPLVVSILPRRVIYQMFILGYSDYWKSPLMALIAKIYNIVEIDPNANLTRAMQVAAYGLKRSRVMIIFPEGTRSIDGKIAEFKKGAAILSHELGVPIVPVGIRGTYEAWPRGGNFGLHPVEFHFGDPIDPKAFAAFPDPYAAITEELQKDVKKLSGQDLV